MICKTMQKILILVKYFILFNVVILIFFFHFYIKCLIYSYFCLEIYLKSKNTIVGTLLKMKIVQVL